MALLKVLQTNFTSGVMDPLLVAREDLTFYYNGLEDGYNFIVIPQGGIKRRPGLQFIKELRGMIEPVDLSVALFVAPNGGNVGNILTDGAVLTTTNPLSTTDMFVVLHIDMITAVAVDMIDIIDYCLTAGALEDELFFQYSDDNSTWKKFGSAFNVDTQARSRRLSADNVSARYWRIVRIGTTKIDSVITITSIRFWCETDDLSNGRLVPFAYGARDVYMLVQTDRHIDILIDDKTVGYAYAPHTSDKLPVLTWTQSHDTLIEFHSDIHPYRLFRQGYDDEFDFRNQEFENIPTYDFGAGIGGVNEVQSLEVINAAAGDTFTLLLDGKRTHVITYGDNGNDTAADIATALRSLSNTSPDGITVSHLDGKFTVTFGGNDGLKPWGEIGISVLFGNMVWSVTRKVEGQYPGEPIMSKRRGYPRCGTFYQNRLHMGGFKSIPNALISSVLSLYYNLDLDQEDVTRALLFRADTDQVSAIYRIFPGRHLSIFTNDGEFYIPNEPISIESVFKQTTRRGSKEGLNVLEVDGALIFLQGVRAAGREIASSVREFLFVDTEQSYQAINLSTLASHLIINPVDIALRKAVNTDETDLILLVNADGSLTHYTGMRDHQVNAFVPARTRDDDKFLAVGVDKERRVYFIIERIINGKMRRFIEKYNDDLLLDCGGIVTVPSESFTAFEGQSEFTWSFSSPTNPAAIGVRVNGGRLAPSEFSVDLGSKTVTLVDPVPKDSIVRIARMIDIIDDLDFLENEMVHVVIDGTAQDQGITVQGGVLALDRYADTEIQYGFNFEIYGKVMPFRVPESETLAGRMMQVKEAIFSLYQTGDIEIRANGGEWRPLILQKMDSPILDRSGEELLFTGDIRVRGLSGVAEGASLEFRQISPSPMTIRAMTRGVAV